MAFIKIPQLMSLKLKLMEFSKSLSRSSVNIASVLPRPRLMSEPECPPERPQILHDKMFVFEPETIGENFLQALAAKPPAAEVMIVPTEIASKLIR